MARLFPKRERIFILPTGQGVIFLLFLIAMILMGAIYTNQLVNLLGFILLTLYALAMVATHQNLAKMKNLNLQFRANFAGETSTVTLSYENDVAEERSGLRMRWWNGKAWEGYVGLPNLMGGAGLRTVDLALRFERRGVYCYSKLQIETRAPLGLFRAWRTDKIDAEIVVYPRRQLLDERSLGVDSDPGQADEWEDPVPLEVNDWARRMDWRRSAKTDGLWTRPWVGAREDVLELDWDRFSHIPLEERLSHFTAALAETVGSGKSMVLLGPWGRRELGHPRAAVEFYELFGRWREGS